MANLKIHVTLLSLCILHVSNFCENAVSIIFLLPLHWKGCVMWFTDVTMNICDITFMVICGSCVVWIYIYLDIGSIFLSLSVGNLANDSNRFINIDVLGIK